MLRGATLGRGKPSTPSKRDQRGTVPKKKEKTTEDWPMVATGSSPEGRYEVADDRPLSVPRVRFDALDDAWAYAAWIKYKRDMFDVDVYDIEAKSWVDPKRV